MNENGLVRALPDLGKRVERLLYFGALLLLACFLELYFVTAAVYVRTENPADIGRLIDRLREKRDELDTLFKNPPRKLAVPSTAEEKRIAALRKSLGLPPKQEEPVPSEERSFRQALENLVNPLSGAEQRISSETRGIVRNWEKSPDSLIVELEARKQQLRSIPVSIWGIESPLIVPVQYGGAQYQVPASFLAISLFFALAPLVVGWLASLHLTRQRELLIVRGLHDYRHAFPHVLNALPVDFEGMEVYQRLQHGNRKALAVQQRFSRVLAHVVRTVVLLAFTAPMVSILLFSAFNLFIADANPSMLELIGVGVLFVLLGGQAIGIVFQEWIVLWGKQFYTR